MIATTSCIDLAFLIKLFFAAPLKGLPSLPTAFGSQASFLHFLTNAVFAAPESGLPSLPMACVSMGQSGGDQKC
jgi:hypothetical protein